MVSSVGFLLEKEETLNVHCEPMVNVLNAAIPSCLTVTQRDEQQPRSETVLSAVEKMALLAAAN